MVLIPYFYCIDKLWSNNYFVKSLNKQCKNKTHAYSEVIHSQNDDFFFLSVIFSISIKTVGCNFYFTTHSLLKGFFFSLMTYSCLQYPYPGPLIYKEKLTFLTPALCQLQPMRIENIFILITFELHFSQWENRKKKRRVTSERNDLALKIW